MIESASSSSGWPFGNGSQPGAGGAETTGRHVVVFAEDDTEPEAVLSDVAGLSSVASSREFGAEGMDMAQVNGADAAYFAELGSLWSAPTPTSLRLCRPRRPPGD